MQSCSNRHDRMTHSVISKLMETFGYIFKRNFCGPDRISQDSHCRRRKCRDRAWRRQHMSAQLPRRVCLVTVSRCVLSRAVLTPLAVSRPPIAGYPQHTHTLMYVYITVACDHTPPSRLNEYLLSFFRFLLLPAHPTFIQQN